MCLLIAKPAGVELPKNFEEICKEASESNAHGSGFATSGAGFKSYLMGHAKFAEVCRENIIKEDPAIIHWRMSTSGNKNDENCHPFRITDGGYFAHNGVIATKYPPRDGLSDTAVLASSVTDCQSLFYKCQELVSTCNKFAIITPANQLVIVGENYGTWGEDKLWYSNMYWKGGHQRWSYHDYGDDYGYYYQSKHNNKSSLKEELERLVRTHGITRVVEELDSHMSQWVLN